MADDLDFISTFGMAQGWEKQDGLPPPGLLGTFLGDFQMVVQGRCAAAASAVSGLFFWS